MQFLINLCVLTEAATPFYIYWTQTWSTEAKPWWLLQWVICLVYTNLISLGYQAILESTIVMPKILQLP